MKLLLTVSIVLYHNRITELEKVINSVLNTSMSIKIFLIDNSKDDFLQSQIKHDDRISYIKSPKNLGYGAAHNIGILESLSLNAKYHLILNPDITFSSGTLETILDFMENNEEVGQVMPKILYNEGDIQRLCKLLPRPIDLIGRRFFRKFNWAKRANAKYELDGFNYDKILDTPSLSGCFMFFRNSILKSTKGFDSRFFMYMEDYDLTRRTNRIAKTVFYPYVEVFHGYKKESYANPVLLKHHIFSALKYFFKWGWFFDKERRTLNRRTLLSIKKSK